MENGLIPDDDRIDKSFDKKHKNEDLDKITDSTVVLSMLQLFYRCKNFRLECKILNIIFKCFSQRAQLIKTLKSIHISFKPNEIAFFQYITQRVTEITWLCEQSELWLNASTKNNKSYTDCINIIKELISALHTNTMYDAITNSLLLPPTENLLDSLISHPRQNMLAALRAHTIIIRLLKDGSHILESLKDSSENENFKKIRLFELCYEFLIKFCKNGNIKNKKLLYKDITLFQHQLPYMQVGQSELICQLFKDSKLWLQMGNRLVETFFDMIKQKGHNPSYLTFFETILDQNDQEILKENIMKILYVIQSDDYRDDIFFMMHNDEIEFNTEQPKAKYGRSKTLSGDVSNQKTSPVLEKRSFIIKRSSGSKSDNLEHVEKVFNFNIKNKKEGDYPFVYHAKIIDIFSECAEKAENTHLIQNMGQKLLPIPYLIKLLTEPDIYSLFDAKHNNDKAKLYSFLKLPLLKYLQNIWLCTQSSCKKLVSNQHIYDFIQFETKKMESLNPQRLQKQDTFINYRRSGSVAFSSFHGEDDTDKNVIVNIEDSIDKYNDFNLPDMYKSGYHYDYKEYIFGYLLPIVVKIQNELLIEVNNISDGASKYFNILNNFSQRFTESMTPLFGDDILSNKRYKSNLETFCTAFELKDFYLSILNESFSMQSRFGSVLNPTLSFITKKVKKAQNDARYIEMLLKKYDYNFHEEDTEKQRSWKSFIMNVSINKTIKKYALKEREALTNTIKKIDEIKIPSYYGNKSTSLSLEKLIKKLMEHIQAGINNSCQSTYTFHSLILLLCDLLECDNQAEIIKMQYLLLKYDAPKLVMSVLCRKDTHHKTLKLLVYLCNQLLHGANLIMQMEFYNYFVTNPNSEIFFYHMYLLISQEIHKNSKPLTDIQKAEMAIENWDYSFKTFTFKISHVLRLLQLLTENHNIYLQTYMRQQINSRVNYNMVELLTKLAGSLCTNITEAKYLTLCQCIDTLTEFIQGPCSDNQIALVDNHFIEIATTILKMQSRNRSTKSLKDQVHQEPKFNYRHYDKKITFLKQIINIAVGAGSDDLQRSVISYFTNISTELGAIIKANFDKLDPSNLAGWMLSRLKHKTILTLEGLLECRKDSYIHKKMMKELPIRVLRENLAIIYRNYENQYGKNNYRFRAFDHMDYDPSNPKNYAAKLELITESGFSIFRILRIFLDFELTNGDIIEDVSLSEFKASFDAVASKGGYNNMANSKEPLKRLSTRKNNDLDLLLQNYEISAIMFFNQYTAHVEILRDDKIYKTYFTILPCCVYINHEIKQNFLSQIKGLEFRAKLNALVTHSNDMINIFKHEEAISSFFLKHCYIRDIYVHIRNLRIISYILVIAQNIFLIWSATYIAPDHVNLLEKPVYSFNGWNPILVLSILGLVQSTLSALIFIFFVIKTGPIFWKKAWSTYKGSLRSPNDNFVSKSLKYFVFTVRFATLALWEFTTLYYLLYTTFAIVSWFMLEDYPIVSMCLLSFLLYDIVLKSSVLKHILRALWRPRTAIFLSIIMFTIMEYQFTIVAFTFFYDEFYGYCNSLRTCFFVTFDNTFKNNGGIGGLLATLDGQYWSTQNMSVDQLNTVDFPRFVYDNIFNLILVILIVQLITGIIVDTFAVLRDEDEQEENFRNNFCFICGKDRLTIDKNGDSRGFNHHVKYDHNHWNYLAYIAYIKLKERVEYNGIESYVYNKLQKNDLSWFPIGRSSQDDEDKDDEESEGKIIQDLDKKVDSVEEQVKKLARKFDLIGINMKKRISSQSQYATGSSRE